MRSILYIYLFLFHVSFIFGNGPKTLVCPVSNTTCLTIEAREIIAALVEGFAPLHTEPLDPMFLDYVHIDDSLKLDLRNCQVTGLKNVVIKRSSLDMSIKILHVQYISDYVLKSEYVIGGSLLSMPVEGKGTFLMKYNNVLVDIMISFDVIKDANNDEIMSFKSYDYTYDVRDSAEYNLDNLYFGNKTASDALHKALHENWKFLTIEHGKYLLDPVTEKIFNSVTIFVRSRLLREIIIY